MRHLKKGRKLSRTDSHRRATLRNLVTSLFEHSRIRTTDAKAKEARGIAEKMITFAKRGDLHARRQVLRFVTSETVVEKLFATIAPSLKERNGGYTRILKVGRRPGDAAPISVLELVNAPEPEVAVTEEEKPKKKRKKADEGEGAESPEASKETARKKRKMKKAVLGAGAKA
jgi:large subunit ribosomal protein L17